MLPRLPRSIRVRLTLWYVAALAALLALFSAGVYVALRETLRDNLDTAVASRADVLLRVVQIEDGRPLLPADTRAPTTDDEDDDDDDAQAELSEDQYLRLFDRAGALVFDSSDPDEAIPHDADPAQRALAGESSWLDRRGDDETFRARVAPIVRDGQVVGALEVGQTTEDIDETLGTLVAIVALAFPLALLAAGGAGMFLAQRALSPIDRITRQARDISAANLNERLGLNLPDDELGRLAGAFDAMLDRLDDAFRRQRQFTADASHELRTPLTILKGQIEVALSSEREAAAYRETLVATAEEIERMIALVNSLLTLARADAGEIPIQRERVPIAELAELTLEQLRPLAEERGVALSAAGPDATIDADPSLLIQLLLNLLDNAIRHTSGRGVVRVTWEVVGERFRLRVTDSGSGIPAEHLPRLFDRFYRVDVARSRAEGGAGIGLSICRWIVEAHGGAISVSSEVGRGSTFAIDLPARASRRGTPALR